MVWDPGFEAAFNPRSIAVLGASTRERGGGNQFIFSIQQMNYQGTIYPVNPTADEIMGLKCYPSLMAVPEVPDLVIVAVSAGRAEAALEECIAKGARNIHMFTAGFAETGEEEGAQLAKKLRRIAKRGKLNIVGPNCMGIYSPRGRISPWGPLPDEVGPIAFLTQSGALGGEFTRMAPDYGLRMSKVISYGNGYVLDCTDYLEYFENDPETKYIGMYLEGVQDGAKLLRQVKRINRKKPVIILKGGLTKAGAKAAASHTGSLAGQDVIWDAFFAQSGAIRVESIDEMVDVMQALIRLPPCTGRGAMLIGAAGGNGVVATDICAREGLEVPDMSEETQAELRTFIDVAGTSVRNPLDVGMQLRGPEGIIRVLDVVKNDPNVDILFIIAMVAPRRLGWWGAGRQFRQMLLSFAKKPRRQPLVIASYVPNEQLETERERLWMMQKFTKAGVPVFKNSQRAARALFKYTGYYRWLEQNQEE
jgi:acyl-CoA synthetase (NDP forming)